MVLEESLPNLYGVDKMGENIKCLKRVVGFIFYSDLLFYLKGFGKNVRNIFLKTHKTDKEYYSLTRQVAEEIANRMVEPNEGY